MSSGSELPKILLTFVFEMNVYEGAWCECICMCVYVSSNWLVSGYLLKTILILHSFIVYYFLFDNASDR